MNKIKVIAVDDSALMRKIISDMINSEPDMEVVMTARNGQDLLEKLGKCNPDVITLDVEMPKMDGIATLKELKSRKYHIPIIMLSSISKRGTRLTMECLETGAFDFISKPSGAISLDLEKIKCELIEKIHLAVDKKKVDEVRVNKAINRELSISERSSNLKNNTRKKINAVTIGASTGGPKALYKVITKLPSDIGVPIFIVQHMPVGFTKAFAERLDNNSKLKVFEAFDGQKIDSSVVYVAPGGFHMEVGKDNKISLNKEPTMWGVRPAVDKLFISASEIYGEHLLSVVLTGMGRDGAQGTIEVKKNGGITISEDESTCTIYGMPKMAYETGMVDLVLPIDEIPTTITKEVWDIRR